MVAYIINIFMSSKNPPRIIRKNPQDDGEYFSKNVEEAVFL